MIHLYLSLSSGEVEDNHIVEDIISLNAGVGLVQAATSDDEVARQVAAAHIGACEGMITVISGVPEESQIRELKVADALQIPVLAISDDATVKMVEDLPVRNFDSAVFLEFVETLAPRR